RARRPRAHHRSSREICRSRQRAADDERHRVRRQVRRRPHPPRQLHRRELLPRAAVLMNTALRLSLLATIALVGNACRRAPRFDPAEAALAAAASDSLTVALADSIAPAQGYVASQAGGPVESISAC